MNQLHDTTGTAGVIHKICPMSWCLYHHFPSAIIRPWTTFISIAQGGIWWSATLQHFSGPASLPWIKSSQITTSWPCFKQLWGIRSSLLNFILSSCPLEPPAVSWNSVPKHLSFLEAVFMTRTKRNFKKSPWIYPSKFSLIYPHAIGAVEDEEILVRHNCACSHIRGTNSRRRNEWTSC